MTLLFLEGFEHHGSTNANLDSTLTRKYFSRTGAWEILSGRSGGNAASGNFTSDDITIEFTTETEIIIGFAMKFREINANSADPLVRFLNPSGSHISSFHRGTSGDPRLISNDNTLYTSSEKWSPFTWNYFEIRIVAGTDSSNGELELMMNGKQIINETGVDTLAITPGVARINFSGSDHFDPVIDDIYIINTQGSVNNTFLGDVKVEAVFPDGAGNTTDLLPTGAASNHEAVDDNPFDDDTSYASSSTFEDKDTYTVANLSDITQGIVGVQMLPNARKAIATGTRALTSVVRSGTTDYDQTESNLTTSYDYYPAIVELDPDTGSAWTVSGFNSAEFGYRISV